MAAALPDHSLDQIFRAARTPNGWADRPVEDDTVREIYDLMKWGPTSANSRYANPVELHLQHRLRRSSVRVSAQSSPEF